MKVPASVNMITVITGCYKFFSQSGEPALGEFPCEHARFGQKQNMAKLPIFLIAMLFCFGSALTVTAVAQPSIDPPAKPAKPTGLSATGGDGRAELSWIDPGDESIDVWKVRYGKVGEEGKVGKEGWSRWAIIPGSGAGTTSHTVTGLENGSEYHFRVKARNSSGLGEPSAAVAATPMAVPAKPVLSATGGDGRAELSWIDPGDESIDVWKVRYGKVGEEGKVGKEGWSRWAIIPGSGAGTTSHTVTGLENGSEYHFRVKARNSSGLGEPSAAVAATPMAVPAKLLVQAIYISPTGDDDMGHGTRASPWRTLEKARDTLRAISNFNEDMSVVLMDGTYHLDETLLLTSEDSGRNGYRITYRAENPGEAIISGGDAVTGWSDPDKDGIFQAAVPAGSDSRQLYVDGIRAVRARSTNGSGWVGHANGTFSAPSAASRWENPGDVELVFLWRWKMYRAPVASISNEQARVEDNYWELAKIGPFGARDQKGVNPAWIENAFELLDTEGEWYLNTRTNTLYYKPLRGQFVDHNPEVILPRLERLILGQGVENVTFDGLKFAHATWLHPSSSRGYVSIQSGAILTDPNYISIEDAFEGLEEIPGNVQFDFSKNIIFSNNEFLHLGATALRLGRSSQSNTIFRNTFTDISGSAITIGDLQDHHVSYLHAVRDNVIDNNRISKVGAEYFDMYGIKLGYTTRTVVANNTIFDLPIGGISLGWGWGRYDVEEIFFTNDNTGKAYNFPTISKNNVLYRNYVYNVTQKIADAAGIYSLGASPGTRIISNVIHDTKRPQYGTAFSPGIYLDNGSRGFEVDDNATWSLINEGLFCNMPNGERICTRYNTVGQNSFVGRRSEVDESIVANAGQQLEITSPRSLDNILAALPARLTPNPLSIPPARGMVVGKKATATPNASDAGNVIDANPRTYWSAGTASKASLTIDLGGVVEVSQVAIAFGTVDQADEIGRVRYIRKGVSYEIWTSLDDEEKGFERQQFRTTARSWPDAPRQQISPTYSLDIRQAINDILIQNRPVARYVKIKTTITDGNLQELGILRCKVSGNKNVNSEPLSQDFSAPVWSNFNSYPRQIGDVNGDGRDDIVGFGGDGKTHVALSDGGRFLPSTPWIAEFSSGWTSFNSYPRLLGDVNGDGRDDIVGFGGDGKTHVALSDGGRFLPSTPWIAEFSSGWTSFNSYPRLLGDVNGDGRDDIVGFGGDGKTHVALSDGGRFLPSVVWSREFAHPEWETFHAFPRGLGDFDGDSLMDIAGFGHRFVSVLHSGNKIFEGEKLQVANVSGLRPSIQFVDNSEWSRNKRLWWPATGIDDQLTLVLNVGKAGNYVLDLRLGRSSDHGNLEFLVNNELVIGEFIGYSARDEMSMHSLRNVGLNSGRNLLTLRVAGKEDSSRGFSVGLDYLLLRAE